VPEAASHFRYAGSPGASGQTAMTPNTPVLSDEAMSRESIYPDLT
jgi:hypothetical protein